MVNLRAAAELWSWSLRRPAVPPPIRASRDARTSDSSSSRCQSYTGRSRTRLASGRSRAISRVSHTTSPNREFGLRRRLSSRQSRFSAGTPRSNEVAVGSSAIGMNVLQGAIVSTDATIAFRLWRCSAPLPKTGQTYQWYVPAERVMVRPFRRHRSGTRTYAWPVVAE